MTPVSMRSNVRVRRLDLLDHFVGANEEWLANVIADLKFVKNHRFGIQHRSPGDTSLERPTWRRTLSQMRAMVEAQALERIEGRLAEMEKQNPFARFGGEHNGYATTARSVGTTH